MMPELLPRNILLVPSCLPHKRLPDPSPQRRHRVRLAASEPRSSDPGRDDARAANCGESAAWEPSGSSASDSQGTTSAAEEAAAMVATCVDLMCRGRLQELLDHLPDAVIDQCILHRKARSDAGDGAPDEGFNFGDALRQARREDFHLDTYAMRALVFQTPQSVEVLSSMSLGPDHFVQRCSVLGASGETATLTFHLQKEERLEPSYRSISVVHKWVLTSITGEASSVQDESGGRPTAPHPRLSPEAVVEAQLAALRLGDFAAVFAFASPQNQAATGPLERFRAMLHTPAYVPLIKHRDASIVTTMQAVPRAAVVVVKVESQQAARPIAYLWFLSLQIGGRSEGCWVTDAVQTGSDDQLAV